MFAVNVIRILLSDGIAIVIVFDFYEGNLNIINFFREHFWWARLLVTGERELFVKAGWRSR